MVRQVSITGGHFAALELLKHVRHRLQRRVAELGTGLVLAFRLRLLHDDEQQRLNDHVEVVQDLSQTGLLHLGVILFGRHDVLQQSLDVLLLCDQLVDVSLVVVGQDLLAEVDELEAAAFGLSLRRLALLNVHLRDRLSDLWLHDLLLEGLLLPQAAATDESAYRHVTAWPYLVGLLLERLLPAALARSRGRPLLAPLNGLL